MRQCARLGISCSSLYYRAKETSEADLSLMGEMDRQYLETPFDRSRRMKAWLERQGISVSRKGAQRMMRVNGLRATYRRPRTSQPVPGCASGDLPFDSLRSGVLGETDLSPLALVQAQLVSRIGGRRNHTVFWGFGGSQHRQPRCVKTVSNGPTLEVCESVLDHTIVFSTEHEERLKGG